VEGKTITQELQLKFKLRKGTIRRAIFDDQAFLPKPEYLYLTLMEEFDLQY
jgi:hypothetical protein